MAELRDLQGNVSSRGIGVDALALQFLILTAARTDEVLWARWSEIILEKREWLGPADRMKSQRPHRVPLSGAAIAILEAMPRVEGNLFVFSGRDRPPVEARRLYRQACEHAQKDKEEQPRRPNKAPAALTPNTFRRRLRALGFETTGHGFRSVFRDWAGDETEHPREVVEAASVHAVGDKTETDRRGDAFALRRKLMDAWAAYLGGSDDNVLKFQRRA
jgi:integrase